MLRSRLAEEFESSGQREYISHRRIVINLLFSMV